MAAAAILVTRPYFEMAVTGIDLSTALLLEQLKSPQPLGDLLECDPAATTTLVTTGALTIHLEIIL